MALAFFHSRALQNGLRGALAALGALALISAPAAAQVRSVDPDTAIDGDLSGEPAWQESQQASDTTYSATPVDQPYAEAADAAGNGTPMEAAGVEAAGGAGSIEAAPVPGEAGQATYKEDDLIGAAESVFGKGAKGLAEVIQRLLDQQGEPNGYIVGREGGGAIGIGVRYGSGTLHHKVEGERPVYWTGPSIGFDAGANAGSAFVLVYNLHDTQDMYHRFPAGEGQAYFVGGFNVSYMRRGDVVMIPVRMGAGLRLGANVGYMRFSEKQRWLPF